MDEIYQQSIANWKRISPYMRRLCLTHLRARLKQAHGLIEHWNAQVVAGKRVGSDDRFFHFGVGMDVRNALREVLADNKLPAVVQPGGSTAKNWDDYYFGALDALARGEDD